MCNAIKLYISQFRAYLVAACAIALFASGWTVAWKIQGARILKKDAEIGVCRQANVTNETTIDRMSRDRESAEKSCQKRLDLQRNTADKLRYIDNLPNRNCQPFTAESTTFATELTTYGGTYDTHADDPVLDRLNRMFSVLPETDR